MSLLIKAILFEDLRQIEHLLQIDSTLEELEEIDDYGFTPLIEAVIAHRIEVIDLLLLKGANVNGIDTTGRSALHWAVDNNDLEICRLLLKYGADPNAYTSASQPLLTYPVLRDQKELKHLLYDQGAQLSFAQDFIQAKLLGHRYELSGQVDIVNAQGEFIPVDYEGFFLEFTLNVIHFSLKRYRYHFSARSFQNFFSHLETVIQIFERTIALLKYQKYTVDITKVASKLDVLLEHPLILLPIAYEGHVISLIKYHNLLIRCDRGENSLKEGGIVVYHMTDIKPWTLDFIKQLLYQRQTHHFITQGLHSLLKLKKLMEIPMSSQVIGNCSWANVEASIPAILFLLSLHPSDLLSGDVKKYLGKLQKALSFYSHWLLWDKKQALEECIQDFEHASPARKATKATIIGAILFQKCQYEKLEDLQEVRKWLKLLMHSDYQYILKSYLQVYWHERKTEAGYNLVQLLDNVGIKLA